MEEDRTVAALPAFLQRVIPIATAIIVVAAIALAGTSTLQQSLEVAADSNLISFALIAGVLPLAATSYTLRVLRWHLLAQRVVPDVPLAVSVHGQVVGFGFAPTPGRVAELYKLKLASEATGAPVARFVPAALVERLTDLAGFGLVVFVGAAATLLAGDDGAPDLSPGWRTALGLSATALAVLGVAFTPLATRLGVGRRLTSIAASVGQVAWNQARGWPGGNRLGTILGDLERGGRLLQDPRAVALAVACVAIGRTADSLVLWRLTLAIGHPIPIPLALAIFGSAGLVGGITFSPGGLGAAELALVGLLVARGLPLTGAMVVALGTRALTFWLWVTLGLATFTIGQAVRALPGSRVRAARPALPEDDRSVEHAARGA
jgi:uncharacterized protein (TIRG00374 family)